MKRGELPQERDVPYGSEIRELSKELFEAIDTCDFTTEEHDRIRTAYHLAMRLHARQAERSDGPYTHHILRVTLRVIHATRGTSADCVIAALLHDAIEDHPKSLAKIMRTERGTLVNRRERFDALFGKDVRDIVLLLTKKKSNLDHKTTRYQHYILHLTRDERALAIKVSDFLDNALVINKKPPELRTRLAKKWKPVAPLLIAALGRLTHEHGILDADMRTHLIGELEFAARELDRAILMDDSVQGPLR